MQYIISLRHFKGNINVQEVETRIAEKLSFIEKIANPDIPVEVKIKKKGKIIGYEWKGREQEYLMRCKFTLNTGEKFEYEVRGKDFDSTLVKLKKGIKENANQKVLRKKKGYSKKNRNEYENIMT